MGFGARSTGFGSTGVLSEAIGTLRRAGAAVVVRGLLRKNEKKPLDVGCFTSMKRGGRGGSPSR